MSKYIYKNKFTGEMVNTDKKPFLYKGFFLFSRGINVDIVKNEIAIGVCVTKKGAKRRIDSGAYDNLEKI